MYGRSGVVRRRLAVERSMARLTYRGVALVLPEGRGIDTVLSRADDDGAGRKLLAALGGSARESLRKLLASIHLAGLKEGIDRALAADLAAGDAPVERGDDDVEPAALRDLRAEVSRGVRSPIQAVVDRFRSSELTLPSLPETAVQLNTMLGNSDHELSAVLEIIRRDVGLTASIIALAGSVRFSPNGRAPRTLSNAVVRLGERELDRFLLAWCNRRLFAFKGRKRAKLLREIWEHSLATALMAELLAEELEGAHPPSYFLHGLLHDVGRPLLVQIFDDIEADPLGAGEFADQQVIQTVDMLHGQFGAALLQKWRFDESFCEVARFHHQPQKSYTHLKLVACVSLADAVVCRVGYGDDHAAPHSGELEDHPAAALIGVDRATLEFATRQLHRKLETLSSGL